MAPRKRQVILAPEPSRAALYIRVSTEDQARDGFGLEVQHRRCEAMATVKGWEVIKEYADEGVSGAKGAKDRPGLAALLVDVEAGKIDAVIVLALDRLGRKTRIVLDLVEQLTVAGAVLVSCKESLDTSTPQGQFVLTMFAALGQLERDLIIERTTAGRDARGMIDGERGGVLPYGYVRGAEGIEINQTAADTVLHILRHKRSGKSYHQIARELNAACVPAPRGGQWYARSVKIVCDNRPIYAGSLRGESVATWPALI